ncbi:hypothetical protein [Legionella fallonii]|uniref:Uncharacterized protein n=1 Tax=Legionella fallonii LLAP-10 TaxID=1212491 RepID=A0A098G178_9GAMM|nr:hypothetical protein [Legionella fallonii]CEG55741.1 protein of unknown function [coiled-coil domain] [Legionella fallonii LLAP-10]
MSQFCYFAASSWNANNFSGLDLENLTQKQFMDFVFNKILTSKYTIEQFLFEDEENALLNSRMTDTLPSKPGHGQEKKRLFEIMFKIKGIDKQGLLECDNKIDLNKLEITDLVVSGFIYHDQGKYKAVQLKEQIGKNYIQKRLEREPVELKCTLDFKEEITSLKSDKDSNKESTTTLKKLRNNIELLEKAIEDLEVYSKEHSGVSPNKEREAHALYIQLKDFCADLKNETYVKNNFNAMKTKFDKIIDDPLIEKLAEHRTFHKNVLANILLYLTIIGGLIDIGMRISSYATTGHSYGLFSKTDGQKQIEKISERFKTLEQELPIEDSENENEIRLNSNT